VSRAGALAAVAVLAALAGGYGLGRLTASPPPAAPAPAPAPARDRPILYYQHPDGTAEYSPGPKTAEDGRAFLPVFGEPEPEAPPPPAPKAAGQGRILYYRHPMGLPDISTVPKTDSMGMAYVPVYENEETGPTVSIRPDKVQALGVRTEAVRKATMSRTIRAPGTVQVNERGLHVVTAKVEGYIERLAVNQTGQPVARGQTLMEVYSPDLVLAQQEYLVARRSVEALEAASPDARAAAAALADGALARLSNWGMPAAQVDRLRRDGQPHRTVSFDSPVAGIVLDKRAVQGMRFMPGDMLYQIADLSSVWVVADLFEQDLGQVTIGQRAQVSFDALPGQSFAGKITFVYPTVTPETRTGKVRIELPNPGGRLKPALYGTVELAAPLGGGPVLVVPDSALLDTGARQVVLVEKGEGRFEPRAVSVGARAGGLVEIRAGLVDGERVVERATFLIDAESNLRAALTGFQSP